MKTVISITFVQACLLQEIVVAAQAIAKKYGETLPHQDEPQFLQWMIQMGPLPSSRPSRQACKDQIIPTINERGESK
jgi:hypothetical protein